MKSVFPPLKSPRFTPRRVGSALLSLVVTAFSAVVLSGAAPTPARNSGARTPASGGGLPTKAPKSVGMSSERLAMIDHVVERGITAGGFPGASVVVGRRGAAVMERGFGRLGWEKSSSAVAADRTI